LDSMRRNFKEVGWRGRGRGARVSRGDGETERAGALCREEDEVSIVRSREIPRNEKNSGKKKRHSRLEWEEERRGNHAGRAGCRGSSRSEKIKTGGCVGGRGGLTRDLNIKKRQARNKSQTTATRKRKRGQRGKVCDHL